MVWSRTFSWHPNAFPHNKETKPEDSLDRKTCLENQNKPQWSYGRSNPCSVQEVLNRKELLPTENLADWEIGVDLEERRMRKMNGLYRQKLQEDEEEAAVLIFSDAKDQRFEDDTGRAITLVALLKACAAQKDVQKGSRIHVDIVRQGLLENNVFIGSSLVSMYAKCGALEKAQGVFDELPIRNVVSWNALLAGYAQCGHGDKALSLYERMQLEGFSPDVATFLSILKACVSIGALNEGQDIHARIVRERLLLEGNITLASSLIDMYAKCGALEKAQEAFNELPAQSVASCNALITGYAQHGCGKEAIECFERMQLLGLSPDEVSFACVLKACGSLGDLVKGKEIHDLITQGHFLEKHIIVANALIDMYAKCGALEKAQEVFDELVVRNTVSWNALISGYALNGHSGKTLQCFEWMQLGGFSPNTITFVSTLKACGNIGALERGQELHAQIVKMCLMEEHIEVSNAVIDMYAKCGALVKAQEVFNELCVKDVISWTALIAGYAQSKHDEEALNYYEQMQLEGFSPNEITFACALKACGSLGAMGKGQEVHAQIVQELVENDMLVANALVDVYAKCGALKEAQDVFDELPVRDVVSWNALIAGYAQHGHGEEALNYVEQMQLVGVLSDAITFNCILKACGTIGAASKGQRAHVEIVRQGLLEKDMGFGPALVDMYANCGLLAEAQDIFDKLPVRTLVLWSALMVGLAQLGKGEAVFNLFDTMMVEGIEPDTVIFTIVLNTCSHGGLLSKGLLYFENIRKRYDINPTLEHHTCAVDLLCRAGHIDEAVTVMIEMLYPTNHAVWHTVLDACQKCGHRKLGKWAFEQAVILDKNDVAAYVCMRNILQLPAVI